jgi:hypothetical protein
MTQSRSKQVSLQDTRYYHLISRCVRRAYLCGEDAYTKQSYEHHRQWMVDRIAYQATHDKFISIIIMGVLIILIIPVKILVK